MPPKAKGKGKGKFKGKAAGKPKKAPPGAGKGGGDGGSFPMEKGPTPSKMEPCDITWLYKIPDGKFKKDEDVISHHGFKLEEKVRLSDCLSPERLIQFLSIETVGRWWFRCNLFCA